VFLVSGNAIFPAQSFQGGVMRQPNPFATGQPTQFPGQATTQNEQIMNTNGMQRFPPGFQFNGQQVDFNGQSGLQTGFQQGSPNGQFPGVQFPGTQGQRFPPLGPGGQQQFFQQGFPDGVNQQFGQSEVVFGGQFPGGQFPGAGGQQSFTQQQGFNAQGQNTNFGPEFTTTQSQQNQDFSLNFQPLGPLNQGPQDFTRPEVISTVSGGGQQSGMSVGVLVPSDGSQAGAAMTTTRRDATDSQNEFRVIEISNFGDVNLPSTFERTQSSVSSINFDGKGHVQNKITCRLSTCTT